MLRNGVVIKVDELKTNEQEVIDNNIVRHIGMTRLPSKDKTPFQLLLEKIKLDPTPLTNEAFTQLARELFYISPLKKVKTSRLITEKDQVFIDAYNDNFRRLFETLFAKKIIEHILHSSNIQNLEKMINEITLFLTREHTASDEKFLTTWQQAKSGIKDEKNDSLNFFSDLRPNLVTLLKKDFLSDEKNQPILKLYDLHYLTHPITDLKSYKKRHPKGIAEIYDSKYENRFTFFCPRHRGRINGFGFNKDNPSRHIGILRSIDQAPYDMISPTLSAVTRCPDRLYMEHPKSARVDLHNWLHHCFSHGYNSSYVNGLSGSILIEIRSMLFFLAAINDKYYECSLLKPNDILEKNHQLIKEYFLLLTSLFIYFEGGHTFSEILAVFEINDVKAIMNEVLKSDKKSDKISKESLLFKNKDMMTLMKTSLIETMKFHSVCTAKHAVHDELKDNPPKLKKLTLG
jgi:hypothetical protein